MGIFCILLILFHAVFAFQYITFRLRMNKKELKYLFEPRVNFMTECQSAARYDAIHVKGWSSILVGALLTPLRLLVVVLVVLCQYIYTFIQIKIYGGEFLFLDLVLTVFSNLGK